MAIIKCPECGHQVSDHAATCPSCGIGIAGNVKRCPDCGAVVFKDRAVCPDCHCPLDGSADAPGHGSGHEEASTPAGVSATQPVLPPLMETDTPVEEAALVEVPPTHGGAEPPVGKSPRKKSYLVIVVTVVILLIVGFVVYYMYDNSQRRSEQDAYETALKSSEPGVLQNFLDLYTDAPSAHRDSIQAHLDLLMQADKDWADVLVSGSKVAIERYLQLHPGSPHEIEGRQRIDSLDWVAAENEATLESYQRYIDAHADGVYIDEARKRHDALDAQQVQSADRELVSQIFGRFFQAFTDNDDDALAATLQPVMDEFLTKTGASKNDVVSYMHKQHSEAWGSLKYTPNDDYKIEKQPSADGTGTEYTVAFSVDEKRTDMEGKAELASLNVTAKVDADGKISSLKMMRLKQ